MRELDGDVVGRGRVEAVEEGVHHVANAAIWADGHGYEDFVRV